MLREDPSSLDSKATKEEVPKLYHVLVGRPLGSWTLVFFGSVAAAEEKVFLCC